MSKKLVAGLIGWLILSLFLMSSVWAAVDKDKAPAPNDKVAQLSKSGIPTKTELLQSRPRWVTWEKMNQDLDRAIRQELSGSAFGAAAGIMEESPFFTPSVLTETAPENFDTAGNSFYDIGSNHRLGRIIAIVPSTRNVGIDWANSENSALTTRNVFGSLWLGASKAGGNVFLDVPSTLTGRGGFPAMTYTVRGGKLALAYHHANDEGSKPAGTYWAVEKNAGNFDWDDDFHVPDSISGIADRAIWTTAAGGYIVDAADYDNDANMTESLDVVHFFGNEGNLTGNSIDRYIYSRAVDSAGVWIYPGFTGTVGAAVDTGIRISPTVVTSKKSRRVALIYTSERQCGFDDACSDVFYIQSTNGGEDWAAAGYNFLSPPISSNRVKVTNFDSSDATRPTGDLMGVYDNDDSLVIAWNQWVTFDFVAGVSAEADIYVWTKQFGIRKAVDGNFTGIPASALIPDPRRQTVNYPHIAVHNGAVTPARTNFLYLTYLQYGGDSGTENGDTAVNGYLNGDVYIVCSTNNGKTWSAPLNMTSSHTPACAEPVSGTGTCSGAAFASCAEMCDDTIHTAYMTDEYAGSLVGADHSAALATNNEVIYMKYPAFTPPAVKRISVSQTNFIQNPGSILTDTFFVQNIGNSDLTVDSIENDSGWLVITDPDTAGFLIAEGDPDRAIVFQVNDAGKPDGVYFDTVVVYNNSANNTQVKIEVIMIVDNTNAFVAATFQTISNGTQLLSVSNTGNLGNGTDTAGFYQIMGPDTTSMLFDGTTFIVMRNGTGDTVMGQYMHSQNALQALLPIHVKLDTTLGAPKTYVTNATAGTDTVTIPAGSYDYARSKFTTFLPDVLGVPFPGAWYGITVEEELWWFPTPTNALVMIQKIARENPPSWWPDVDKGTDGFTAYIGHGIDFDATTDTNNNSGNDNWGRKVPGYGLLWQEGADPSSNYEIDSLLEKNGHFTALMNLGNGSTVDPPAMHIVSNRYGLYPGEGYVADTLYRIAGDVTVDTVSDQQPSNPGLQFKFFSADTAQHDSLPVDLNSVMTMWALAGGDATPKTTAAAAFVVVDIGEPNSGCFTMTSNYQKLRQILGLDSVATKMVHSAAACSTAGGCTAKPGDANASGTYTLGDIISTVNYIFNKPGCTPLPLCWLSGKLCRGDWNGSNSVTLGDAIQGVNYIFSKPGGPWFPVASGECCIPYTP